MRTFPGNGSEITIVMGERARSKFPIISDLNYLDLVLLYKIKNILTRVPWSLCFYRIIKKLTKRFDKGQ